VRPDIILALIASLPPTILATAAWRTAGKSGGPLEDLKQAAWFQAEEIQKIMWFLVEHQQRHGQK